MIMKKIFDIFGILMLFVLVACGTVEADEPVLEEDPVSEVYDVEETSEILSSQINIESGTVIYNLLKAVESGEIEAESFNDHLVENVYAEFNDLREAIVSGEIEAESLLVYNDDIHPEIALRWSDIFERTGGGNSAPFQQFMLDNRELFPGYGLMEAGWDGSRDVTENFVFKIFTYYEFLAEFLGIPMRID